MNRNILICSFPIHPKVDWCKNDPKHPQRKRLTPQRRLTPSSSSNPTTTSCLTPCLADRYQLLPEDILEIAPFTLLHLGFFFPGLPHGFGSQDIGIPLLGPSNSLEERKLTHDHLLLASLHHPTVATFPALCNHLKRPIIAGQHLASGVLITVALHGPPTRFPTSPWRSGRCSRVRGSTRSSGPSFGKYEISL